MLSEGFDSISRQRPLRRSGVVSRKKWCDFTHLKDSWKRSSASVGGDAHVCRSSRRTASRTGQPALSGLLLPALGNIRAPR